MNRTNSNSITSILVVALNNENNNESENNKFRKEMLDLFFGKKRNKRLDNVKFYDCTHSPLLYEEMGGTEIDIIARIPGQHKPVMMIEVKASIGETLQDSQVAEGAYENTANKHEIPLVYIIPKNYIHKDKLPKNSKDKPKLKVKIILWEDIKKHISDMDVSFEKQIEQFVETYSDNNDLSNEEKALLKDKELLIQIYNFKKEKLDMIKAVLDKKKRRISPSPQEDQWGVGFYYSYKNYDQFLKKRQQNDYFIGFNPYYKDDKFFALCIAETCKNIHLGDKKDLYFEDGYYFIPILKSNCIEGDKDVLDEIRTSFKGLFIQPEIKTNLSTFFSLKTKIGDEKFFFNENDAINTKKYESLLKRYNLS